MNNKIPLVVIGSSGHAKIVIDILEQMKSYEIVGITTKSPEVGNSLMGYPFLGTDDLLPSLLSKGIQHAAIGVGGFIENQSRKIIWDKLKAMGFKLVTAIHPSAIISPHARIGNGCVIFAGVTINPDVSIGNNVVIATNSSVDHETIIEDHALISAGVTVGGNNTICEGALLAIGSVIVSGKRVGKYSLVAAGAVVVDDVPDGIAVAGIPARNFYGSK